jgi:hypothetical protein
VHGIGEKKAAAYGDDVLSEIAAYCTRHRVSADAK